MERQQTKRISKFLSLVLRHRPEAIGIQLDDSGWIEIDVLLSAMAANGRSITRDQLEQVVETNDKNRFSISNDGTKIRAKQGHSVDVDLGYQPAEPPELLCHGTPAQLVSLIRRSGLKKMKRHHVHLHADQSLAVEVGGRRGKPVLLKVQAGEMHKAGFEFFMAENQVWLTDHVPSEYIVFPETE